MPTKTIKVPAPITVTLPNGNSQKFTFQQFLRDSVLSDPSFGTDWDAVFSAEAVLERLESIDQKIAESAEKNPYEGIALELDERDFDRVYAAAKRPSPRPDLGGAGGYNASIIVKLAAFLHAIKNAKEE